MTNEWQEKLKKFQEARKAKSAWYEKTAREILEEHKITACHKCDCRGWGRETKHSRAHAHTKKRIVCLNAEPKNPALEMGQTSRGNFSIRPCI